MFKLLSGAVTPQLNDLAIGYDITVHGYNAHGQLLVELAEREVPDQLVERRPVCFIAAPYAARTQLGEADNIRRAEALGRLAVALGYVPVVVHSNGERLYGPDTHPESRAVALSCSTALVRQLATLPRSGMYVLLRDNGTMSNGVAAEVSDWQQTGDPDAITSKTWDDWEHAFRAVQLHDLWLSLRAL